MVEDSFTAPHKDDPTTTMPAMMATTTTATTTITTTATTAKKMRSRTRRSLSTLMGIAALAACSTPIDGADRSSSSSASASAARSVELPRHRLPLHHAAAGNNNGNNFIDNREEDILPSPLSSIEVNPERENNKSSSSPRNLLLDGTTTTSTTTSPHRHSSHHTILSTSYSGIIPSSSIEFRLENHHPDGNNFAIVSGMGIHVQIVEEGSSTKNSPKNEHPSPAPCRVQVYTKRGTSGIAAGLETAAAAAEAAGDANDGSDGTIAVSSAAQYELALDAKVLCEGKGEETLLSSDLFLRSYRESQEEEADAAATASGGGSGGTRQLLTTKETTSARGRRVLDTNVENMEQGTVTGNSHMVTDKPTSSGQESVGLSETEKRYPLLIPPNETISVYVVVLPLEETSEGTSFQLLSSNADPAGDGDKEASDKPYKVDPTLNLYMGSSILKGSLVNPPDDDGTSVQETGDTLEVKSPTVFNGAIYYDSFDGTTVSLGEYYNQLEYSLLPGDSLHGLPGCDKSMSTGYIDTVGSYGVMFDVSSAIEPQEVKGGSEGEEEEFDIANFKNVEIYGMDLYIRNIVNASFEVFVRLNDDVDHALLTRQKYMSYSIPSGQTLISENWERIARGVVEGRGPDVGTPIPADAWRKNIVLRPGETAGLYVTVKGAPDLRYRNSTKTEGSIFASDDILKVGVGRSWGEFPLRGDGTDVYFAPREFSGSLRYHVHEGLCESTAPSASPTFGAETDSPSQSLAPTAAVMHAYSVKAEEEGLCEMEEELETTFDDGTGSYGGLFDVLAKVDVVLTGIDLNMDWNTDSSAHVLIYARKGSWFGHQNNAESWPNLIVNTTIHRPSGFHNRSTDGPYIPIAIKKASAIIPRKHFKPLEMKAGETWSLYVCTSVPDFRYTLGSSIGKKFATNQEIRVMEGAGAADYPPFLGGTPEGGGVEYTFYAPRVFNGNLRYEFVQDCPSEAPSAVYSTPVPTPVPSLTTSVSYTFYVEHSPDMLQGAVTYDMSFGVRAVLDRFLAGDEDILFGYARDHELVIERVAANLVSPAEIGYLCYPTPPETCTPISVDVTATHRATATNDDIMYALLRQSMHLPSAIDVEGYTIQYVGDRAVETNSEITVEGVPDRLMGESEQQFFEKVARDFLRAHVKTGGDGKDSLRILGVVVNGQDITSSDDDANSTTPLSPTSTSSVMPVRNNNPNRKLQGKKSNNIQVSVRGKYRPPPELDFGEIIEDSINRDRELLQKELNKPIKMQAEESGESGEGGPEPGYFENAKVVGARQIKGKDGNSDTSGRPSKTRPTQLGAVSPTEEKDDDMKEILHLAAMGVGGMIGLLSIVFLLRPHRRRALFSSGKEDNRAHRKTQLVDVEEDHAGLLKKNRAMVRGWGSEGLTDSGNSFSGASQVKGGFNPHSSINSERMLAYSDFSSGHPQGFDPNGSGTSGAAVGTGSSNGGSFTRGPSNSSATGRPLNGSSTQGGGPLNSSATSGPLNGSFTRGVGGPLNSSYTSGPMNGSFTSGPPCGPIPYDNQGPPRRQRGPPGAQENPFSSLPPVRAGPPMGMGHPGPLNHSMPPARGRRISQESVPPRGMRRPSHDVPPGMGGMGMSMPPQRGGGQFAGGEAGARQMHDPRRNHSMMPEQHHPGYR